jgi:hypothetical protein
MLSKRLSGGAIDIGNTRQKGIVVSVNAGRRLWITVFI